MINTHNASPDPAHELAIFWVTRLQSGDCTDTDRQAFADWLAQDQAHRTAHQEVKLFWDSLSQIEPHAKPQLVEAVLICVKRGSGVGSYQGNVWRVFYQLFL